MQSEEKIEEAVRSITPMHSEYASYAGSKLATSVHDVIQHTQAFMENLLPLIRYSEIDAGAVEIKEEVERCKESSLDRKCKLEQERERFQQAASTVLEMLNQSSHTMVAATHPAMIQEESHQSQD